MLGGAAVCAGCNEIFASLSFWRDVLISLLTSTTSIHKPPKASTPIFNFLLSYFRLSHANPTELLCKVYFEMKRKIEESSTEGGLESCNPSDPKASCPSYGSQHYWDERYQKNNSSDPKDRDQQKDENEDDETSPGFSWYFTYNELRPLLLPLVLGRGEEEETWSDCDEEMEDILDDDGEDDEADEDSEIKNANEEEADSQEDNKDDDVDGDNSSNIDDEDIDGLEENENKNENENSSIDDDERSDVEESFTFDPNRSPQTVLEIGCGDAPVGDELCRNILQIQEKTKVDAKKMVDRIVCFDYSKTCIDFQQEKQRQEQKEQLTELNSKESTLRVDYKVHDARDLPYKDKEFNVIIDKGTLDAMLSDKVEGKNNCVKIISEAARTLAIEGYLLIVSHLNANGPEGLSWVDEVLAAGLKDGDSESSFRIEVHGNDADDDDEVEDGLKVKEIEQNEEDSKHYGPAVYIIQKKDNSQTKSAEECPRVDMKFFGY